MAAVAGSVVGEDPLDTDPARGVVEHEIVKERDAVVFAVCRADLTGGVAGVIIDGDVHVMPTGAIADDGGVTGDAFAGLPEASEFLGVEVHHRPDRLVLVAVGRRPGLSLAA